MVSKAAPTADSSAELVADPSAELVAAPAVASPASGNPYTSDQSIIAEGAAIFASSCASCHGTHGDGDGESAPVDAIPKAFAHMRVPPGMLDSYRFAVIQRGVDNTMPSFKGKLSEEDTWKVVTFLSTLSSARETAPEQDLWSVSAPRLTRKMSRQGRRLFLKECSS